MVGEMASHGPTGWLILGGEEGGGVFGVARCSSADSSFG
jgi:hypothetical protein